MLHNYFEKALTAMVAHLNSKLKPYATHIQQPFPIMIMNTGDEVFISNMNKDNSKPIYNRIPRMVLDFDGLSIPTDQLTSPHIHGRFIEKDDVTDVKSLKIAKVRRVPVEFAMNSQVYFSNVFEFLSFIEILLSTTYKNNVFKFYHNDILFKGSYSYSDSFDPQSNKTLTFDSDKRQKILPLNFNVELQYPAFDYYNSTELLDGTSQINTVIHRTHANGVYDIESSEQVQYPSSEE